MTLKESKRKLLENRTDDPSDKTFLKIEHFAEGIVKEFFSVFIKGSYEIDAYDCFSSLKETIKLKSHDLILNKNATTEVLSQVPVKGNFEIAKEWYSILESKDEEIVIDDLSCFDGVIFNSDNVLIPIEVKSGFSETYKTLNRILKKSFIEKRLRLNKNILLGDMISMFGSPKPQSSGSINELNFNPPKILRSNDFSLHPEWILIIRNKGQVQEQYMRGFKFRESGLRYILTLEDIVEFLKGHTETISKEKDLSSDSHLYTFERSIINDLRYWLNHETIKKPK